MKRFERMLLWVVKKAARGELDEEVAKLRAAIIKKVSGWIAVTLAWLAALAFLLEGLKQAVEALH